MKKILVPTDFSDNAAAAYDYAALLAEKTSATIYLLHILDIPHAAGPLPDADNKATADVHYMMEVMKLIKLRIEKLKNNKVFKSAKVVDIIEIGNVPSKICLAAKKYKADIIVMGTHGVSGFQESFIGSNAERVIRNAAIPVLSVKNRMKNSKISTIVFASDFSKETELVLPAISKIAEIFKARLILMKIVTMVDFQSSHETEKQVEEFRKKNKLFNYSTQIYYAYSKEEGIRNFSENAGADLIALGTHGRHGLAHFFKGSVAEEVVNHASLPVLTLNFHKNLFKSPAKGKSKQKLKTESDWSYQIPSI